MAMCRIGLDYLRFQAVLWEVFRVEGEDEVCPSLLGTNAECIVLGIERYFPLGANLDQFSLPSNEINERADRLQRLDWNLRRAESYDLSGMSDKRAKTSCSR